MEQLASRRQWALDLLHQGPGPTEVAKWIGATPQRVCRWRRESQKLNQKRKRNRRTPGRPSRLSQAPLQQLASALERGAYANGYAEDYWTLDRMAHLIWDLFGVRYRPSSVWHLMQRAGWSCQKPQRRSLARDDEAVALWKRSVWPQVKDRRGLRATLVFVDEWAFRRSRP